jgi:hypothetical protein
MLKTMGRVLTLDLDNQAGKVSYLHPVPHEQFIEKGWRTLLELNGGWARRALAIDFSRVSAALRSAGYKEAPHWPVEWSSFSPTGRGMDIVYLFDPTEGGLVKGIIQLARDCDSDPRKDNIIAYTDTNIDTKAQQDYLVQKCVEYVDTINRLLV